MKVILIPILFIIISFLTAGRFVFVKDFKKENIVLGPYSVRAIFHQEFDFLFNRLGNYEYQSLFGHERGKEIYEVDDKYLQAFKNELAKKINYSKKNTNLELLEVSYIFIFKPVDKRLMDDSIDMDIKRVFISDNVRETTQKKAIKNPQEHYHVALVVEPEDFVYKQRLLYKRVKGRTEALSLPFLDDLSINSYPAPNYKKRIEEDLIQIRLGQERRSRIDQGIRGDDRVVTLRRPNSADSDISTNGCTNKKGVNRVLYLLCSCFIEMDKALD